MRKFMGSLVLAALATTPAIAKPSSTTRTEAGQSANAPASAVRLIVLTDIGNEPDDAESMVRLMLYTNDIDVEGLIAATSRHLPHDPHPEMIEARVDAYAQSFQNLHKQDRRYPDPQVLRSKIRTGSRVYGMTGVGEGKDTDASRLIIEAVDRPDPRPVWIAVWGGAADLAQALWRVRADRTPDELAKFVGKLRVYSISDQDNAGPWARAYFPLLFWETSIHGFTNYDLGTWLGISAPAPGADQSLVSKEWLSQNIRNKGPMGAVYPLPAYIMEGDTPSFLSLIPNGLNVPDRPDWGGWGGRYARLSDELGLWTTVSDYVRSTIDGKVYATPQATIWRWRSAFQNDFAARMIWSVTDRFSQANHAPFAQLNGRAGSAPVEIEACPNQPVSLSAAGSKDPDGDRLSYHWSWYREASGLFAPPVTLSGESGAAISVTIGDKASTDQFTAPASYSLHVILEVQDSGTPQLTTYRRVIIKVPGIDATSPSPTCAVRAVPPSH